MVNQTYFFNWYSVEHWAVCHEEMMSLQRWWWHFCCWRFLCMPDSQIYNYAVSCKCQVIQPFLDCGRNVSANWSCMLERAVLYIECTDRLHWNVYIYMCVCVRVHVHVFVYTHAHTLALVLSSHYLRWVDVSIVTQLCRMQWVRWLTMVSEWFTFSPFYHRHHSWYQIFLFRSCIFRFINVWNKYVWLTISMPVVISNVHIAHGQSNYSCHWHCMVPM